VGVQFNGYAQVQDGEVSVLGNSRVLKQKATNRKGSPPFAGFTLNFLL
jgi:hypothetical protein